MAEWMGTWGVQKKMNVRASDVSASPKKLGIHLFFWVERGETVFIIIMKIIITIIIMMVKKKSLQMFHSNPTCRHSLRVVASPQHWMEEYRHLRVYWLGVLSPCYEGSQCPRINPPSPRSRCHKTLSTFSPPWTVQEICLLPSSRLEPLSLLRLFVEYRNSCYKTKKSLPGKVHSLGQWWVHLLLSILLWPNANLNSKRFMFDHCFWTVLFC